jgi:hypothetical protein
MNEIPADENIWLGLEIPEQPGMGFLLQVIVVNGDELSLQTEFFTCEWFPISRKAEVDDLIQTVTQIIRGTARFRCRCISGVACSSRLQVLKNAKWRTVAYWGTPFAFIPFLYSTKIVRNRPPDEPLLTG